MRLAKWEDSQTGVEELTDDADIQHVISEAAAYREKMEKSRSTLVNVWTRSHHVSVLTDLNRRASWLQHWESNPGQQHVTNTYCYSFGTLEPSVSDHDKRRKPAAKGSGTALQIGDSVTDTHYNSFGTLEPSVSDHDKRRKPAAKGSGSALQTGEIRRQCAFCNKQNHNSNRCFKYLKLNVIARQKMVKSCNLCFKCLSTNHFARDCNQICNSCKGKHHSTLCYKSNKVSKNASSNVDVDTSVKKSDTSQNKLATLNVANNVENVSILPAANVSVRGSDDQLHACTLKFDSDSELSYVSNSLVKNVNPKWLRNTETTLSTFGDRSHSAKSKVSELVVKGIDKEVSVQTTEVPVICPPLSKPQVGSKLLEMFDHLHLADTVVSGSTNQSIDILVGQDLFWSLMLDTFCSAFLLAVTICHHLSICPPSVAVKELSENLYVDDFLSGGDSASEAHSL
jgi:hypothetical protein